MVGGNLFDEVLWDVDEVLVDLEDVLDVNVCWMDWIKWRIVEIWWQCSVGWFYREIVEMTEGIFSVQLVSEAI